MVLQVLGDERLIIRELTSRINVLLGLSGERGSRVVWEGDIRYLTSRMMRAGQLDREPESFRNKIRYRYFRADGLEGPIADLDRAFREGDDV